MLGRLLAILTFRRRADCLTGPAKVIDGDTIIAADQLVSLHGIDAPELDQTFQWRGQQIACGTMSLAALEALIAGSRCAARLSSGTGTVAKVFSPNGVDIGRRLVSAGWAELGGLAPAAAPAVNAPVSTESSPSPHPIGRPDGALGYPHATSWRHPAHPGYHGKNYRRSEGPTMADEQQLAVLRQGSDAWNAWRHQNRDVLVDLFGAGLSEANLGGVHLYQANLSAADLAETNLSGASLSKANLFNANLTKANLTGADLTEADLSEAGLSLAKLLWANLTKANFTEAALTGANLTDALLIETYLGGADLSGSNLGGAYLIGANLTEANLGGANLTGANLTRANLVGTNLEGANLTGCRVYGISAWNLKLNGAEQKNLIITPPDEAEITVDNLEVAQFIYLLLRNEKIRHVIDTITSKVVLILGRFTPERKAVLDALRDELRQRDYTPVLFDFEKPRSRSTLETVSTLAHMARFMIADLTDAKSVLQELQEIVPTNPSVPVQPLILETQDEPGMFDFIRRFPWVLAPYRYPDATALLAALADGVIVPAAAKLRELRGGPPPTP